MTAAADPFPEFSAALAEVNIVMRRLTKPRPGDTVETLRAALVAARHRLSAANDAMDEAP